MPTLDADRMAVGDVRRLLMQSVRLARYYLRLARAATAPREQFRLYRLAGMDLADAQVYSTSYWRRMKAVRSQS